MRSVINYKANSFVIAVETQWLATHTEAPMTLEARHGAPSQLC